MDEGKLGLLLGTLMAATAVQAGQIAQLRGANFREARSAALDQYVRLLAASGFPDAAGQMKVFENLLEREFPDHAN